MLVTRSSRRLGRGRQSNAAGALHNLAVNDEEAQVRSGGKDQRERGRERERESVNDEEAQVRGGNWRGVADASRKGY